MPIRYSYIEVFLLIAELYRDVRHIKNSMSMLMRESKIFNNSLNMSRLIKYTCTHLLKFALIFQFNCQTGHYDIIHDFASLKLIVWSTFSPQ